MYPNNGTPGVRATASTFSALPVNGGVDDRFGQFLIKFDTVAAGIPAGLGVGNYDPKRVVLTTVIYLPVGAADTDSIVYDPTGDAPDTYGPSAVADSDPGRPMELHGAGFRGTFTAANFQETSAFGSGAPGGRNAYALGYSPEGVARDVSNNVASGFDAMPWAIGKVLVPSTHTASGLAELPAGERVPLYAYVVFELNLSLPGVAAYVKQGCQNGYLWLTLTSLHSVTQQAAGGYPSYFTRDSEDQKLAEQFPDLFDPVAPALDVEYSLPLRIAGFNRNSGTGVSHLEWNASPGFQYVVETSTDLAPGSWKKLTTNPLTTTTPVQMTFNAPDNGGRAFYRIARLQP